MEIVITLLSIAFFVSLSFAVYYKYQYEKILDEYYELDLELQELKHDQACKNAKRKAIKNGSR